MVTIDLGTVNYFNRALSFSFSYTKTWFKISSGQNFRSSSSIPFYCLFTIGYSSDLWILYQVSTFVIETTLDDHLVCLILESKPFTFTGHWNLLCKRQILLFVLTLLNFRSFFSISIPLSYISIVKTLQFVSHYH